MGSPDGFVVLQIHPFIPFPSSSLVQGDEELGSSPREHVALWTEGQTFSDLYLEISIYICIYIDFIRYSDTVCAVDLYSFRK